MSFPDHSSTDTDWCLLSLLITEAISNPHKALPEESGRKDASTSLERQVLDLAREKHQVETSELADRSAPLLLQHTSQAQTKLN